MTMPESSVPPLPEAERDAVKAEATAWFTTLRDRIVAALETLEAEATGPFHPDAPKEAGTFEKTPWQRTDHSGAPGGGGVMALGQKLMSAGVPMGQMQPLGQELFAYGREKAGEDVMGPIVGSIPGLSQFV